MPNPFPGIDPYLESQGYWPDFHARFLIYCCDDLASRLPASYVAQIDERIRLVEPLSDEGSLIRPDLMIERLESTQPVPVNPSPVGKANLEPVVIPLMELEEARETRIRILHTSDRSVVTILELLSPSNKENSGFYDYLDKRHKLLAQPINLVELDLLLGGQRLPMGKPLPPGDFYALVARAQSRPNCEVYGWSIRQPLPVVPVPLRPPDADVALNLAELYTTALERGSYSRLMDYHAPLRLPLASNDRAWAEQLARTAAPR